MRGRIQAAVAGLVLVLAAAPARAQVPDYEGEFFTDLTHSVSARQKVEISRTLRVAAESSRVHPMLVVVDRMASYPDLPQNEKDFATRLFEEWKIGDATTKKGVLALFSIGDRKYYIVKSTNVDQSMTDSISDGFKQGTLTALRDGNVTKAMTLAAQTMATSLMQSPAPRSVTSTPVHTFTRTTHDHHVDGQAVPWTPPSHSYHVGTGGGACCFFIIGSFLLLWFFVFVIRSLTGTGGYGPNYGGYYGGGGGYYGGGGGGGGFLSGMATGGLLGYLFGSGGSSGYSSGWGGGWGSGGGGSYTDTTTTETWSSGGGSSDWSSGGGGDSGGGGFDSFGGGSTDGGGSGGSW
jgi:uncharacterized protein